MTLLLYKRMFRRIGNRTTLSSPLYIHHPEYVTIGDRVYIGPNCRIETYPDELPQEAVPSLTIGQGVSIGHGVTLTCRQTLVIEDDALIASGCYISDNNHAMDPEGPRYADQPLTYSPTVVGSGVWLGQNVCVLAGAKIGERSIIGAGSVVRGLIPPYSVAVGAPARVVKRYSFESKRWEKVKQV